MVGPDPQIICATCLLCVFSFRELFGGEWEIQRGSLLRESLCLFAFQISSKQARMAWLARNIPKFRGCGIVYVLTKSDAEQVTDWLRSKVLIARIRSIACLLGF